MVLSRNRHQTDTQNCLLSLMLGRFTQSVNLKPWLDFRNARNHLSRPNDPSRFVTLASSTEFQALRRYLFSGRGGNFNVTWAYEFGDYYSGPGRTRVLEVRGVDGVHALEELAI